VSETPQKTVRGWRVLLAEAEAERDEARKSATQDDIAHQAEAVEWKAECATLRAEVERLRQTGSTMAAAAERFRQSGLADELRADKAEAALRKYGAHQGANCGGYYGDKPEECECGLNAALRNPVCDGTDAGLGCVCGHAERHVPAAVPREECHDCDGCGWVEGGKALQSVCPTCKGTGEADVQTETQLNPCDRDRRPECDGQA